MSRGCCACDVHHLCLHAGRLHDCAHALKHTADGRGSPRSPARTVLSDAHPSTRTAPWPLPLAFWCVERHVEQTHCCCNSGLSLVHLPPFLRLLAQYPPTGNQYYHNDMCKCTCTACSHIHDPWDLACCMHTRMPYTTHGIWPAACIHDPWDLACCMGARSRLALTRMRTGALADRLGQQPAAPRGTGELVELVPNGTGGRGK